MSVYTSPETTISNMSVSPNAPPHERSLGELFGDLTRETTDLVRQEINLAKAELTQKAAALAKDAGMIAAGGFIAYTGSLTIVAAIVLVLIHIGLSPWLAALIVGLVFVVGGGLIAYQGVLALKHIDPVPHQTVETLKEDKELLKRKVR